VTDGVPLRSTSLRRCARYQLLAHCSSNRSLHRWCIRHCGCRHHRLGCQ